MKSSFVRLNIFQIFHILIVVVINILLTDFKIPTTLKIALSALPFLVLLFCYFKKDKSLFYRLLIVYTFAFPFSPRDLQAFREGTDPDFISYINLSVGFISLSLFSLMFFTFWEVVRLKLLKRFILSFALIFGILITYSLILSLFYGIYPEFFVTDLKPFVLFFFGYFFGICLWKRYKTNWDTHFIWICTFLLAVYTIKTSYYVLHDFIYGSTVYEFLTQPYLFVPILFMAFFTMKNVGFRTRVIIIIASFISSFSISRGFILMLGFLALILPFFYINKKNRWKVFTSYFVSAALIGLFVVFSPLILSEKAYVFLQYKLQFFSTELGKNDVDFDRSTVIRIYEFKNIWHDLLNNPLFLFIGKGFGSYFEFRTYALPVRLDVDAYSYDQISLGKFFRPHTFFNVALLKGGLTLLFLYSYKNIKNFFYSARVLKKKLAGIKANNFIVFAGIFSLLYLFFFWIPEYLFLSGLIFSYFKLYRKT